MIKTFRGQLADDGQDSIRLQTIKGKMGYRIIKFQIMNPTSTGNDRYSVAQIWKTEQPTPSTTAVTLDFNDNILLGVAVSVWDNTQPMLSDQQVIFDQEIFNQDIFITHTDIAGGGTCNYYIELEVISLTDSDAEFTTLKDIRGRNTTP